MEISPEYVRAVLSYDPESGLLRWNARTAEMFGGKVANPERECSRWNNRYAGTVAGMPDRRGYIRVKLSGKRHAAHRLIWALMTGEWPQSDIDHANLVKDDNRWVNLRLASRSENTANRSAANNNTTGLKGVTWHKANRKWTAHIGFSGKHRYLGSFDCPVAAWLAYQIEADRLFGEFARAA